MMKAQKSHEVYEIEVFSGLEEAKLINALIAEDLSIEVRRAPRRTFVQVLTYTSIDVQNMHSVIDALNERTAVQS